MKNEKKLHLVPGNFGILLALPGIFQICWFLILFIPDLLVTLFKKFFPGTGKNVAGKNILITGAGSGLGKAIAFEFAKKGSKVICVDINQETNEKTVREINEEIGEPNAAKSFVCDVSDSKTIKKLEEDVRKDFERVDILICNAGLIYGGNILEEEMEMVKKVVAVNQMSAYLMVRAFLPKMKEQNDGHLVFINSIASLTALGDATVYTMTKFGLFGLSSALADEFSRDPSCSNIKISSVHPFFIATEGLKAQPLSSRIIMMKVEDAAVQIIRGIRREYFNFTVPGYETGFWFLSLSRVIPRRVYNRLVKMVYNQVLLPEDK